MWSSSSAESFAGPSRRSRATLSAIGSQLGALPRRAMRGGAGARAAARAASGTAHAAAETSAKTMRRLEQIAQAALAHLFSPTSCAALLEQIAGILDADTSAILLLDERSAGLTLRAAVGFHEEGRAPCRCRSARACGPRGREREAIVVDDLDEIELVSPVLRAAGSSRSSRSRSSSRIA